MGTLLDKIRDGEPITIADYLPDDVHCIRAICNTSCPVINRLAAELKAENERYHALALAYKELYEQEGNDIDRAIKTLQHIKEN